MSNKFASLVDDRDIQIINDNLLNNSLEFSNPDKVFFMSSIISFDEFASALASIKVKSTPGPDFISFKMIKKSSENCFTFFVRYFQ